jgi:MFS family permease
MLPLTAAIVVVAPLAGRLADLIGPRAPVAAGMTLLAVALLGLAGVRVRSTMFSLVPWFTLAGVGIGLTTTPTTTAAMNSARDRRHGVAAGALNTFRWTGLALGIALMGAVVSSASGGTDAGRAMFVDGFSHAVTINAAIALIAAAVALLTFRGRAPRRRRPRAPDTASAARALAVRDAPSPG